MSAIIWLIGWMFTCGLLWDDRDSRWWFVLVYGILWPVMLGVALQLAINKMTDD